MKPARAFALLLVVACGDASGPDTSFPCPSGHGRDAVRSAEIASRLGTVPVGEALLGVLPSTRGMCFARDAMNVVTTDRVMLVSSDLAVGEAAARLGHLLVHVRDGLPMGDAIPPGADCEALVRTALDREAVAYVTEVRLQRALSVVPRALSFEFADALDPLDDPRATSHVRAYLQAHPTGAPNMDGLAAGYRERCLRER